MPAPPPAEPQLADTSRRDHAAQVELDVELVDDDDCGPVVSRNSSSAAVVRDRAVRLARAEHVARCRRRRSVDRAWRTRSGPATALASGDPPGRRLGAAPATGRGGAPDVELSWRRSRTRTVRRSWWPIRSTAPGRLGEITVTWASPSQPVRRTPQPRLGAAPVGGAAVVGVEDLLPRLAAVDGPPVGTPLAEAAPVAVADAAGDEGDDLVRCRAGRPGSLSGRDGERQAMRAQQDRDTGPQTRRNTAAVLMRTTVAIRHAFVMSPVDGRGLTGRRAPAAATASVSTRSFIGIDRNGL